MNTTGGEEDRDGICAVHMGCIFCFFGGWRVLAQDECKDEYDVIPVIQPKLETWC